jgi:hypothetical protein
MLKKAMELGFIYKRESDGLLWRDGPLGVQLLQCGRVGGRLVEVRHWKEIAGRGSPVEAVEDWGNGEFEEAEE